MIILIR